MGKKNRKPVPKIIGNPTGFKQLGKPLTVLYASYPTDHIRDVYVANSEDGDFTSLDEYPVMVEDVKLLTPETGYSLGVVIVSDPTKLVSTENGWVFTTGTETLPFKVGETLGWRSAKIGHLLEEDEQVIVETKNSGSFYSERFPGWDGFYKIEQVFDITGWSDSLNILLDKKVNQLTSNF